MHLDVSGIIMLTAIPYPRTQQLHSGRWDYNKQRPYPSRQGLGCSRWPWQVFRARHRRRPSCRSRRRGCATGARRGHKLALGGRRPDPRVPLRRRPPRSNESRYRLRGSTGSPCPLCYSQSFYCFSNVITNMCNMFERLTWRPGLSSWNPQCTVSGPCWPWQWPRAPCRPPGRWRSDPRSARPGTSPPSSAEICCISPSLRPCMRKFCNQ